MLILQEDNDPPPQTCITAFMKRWEKVNYFKKDILYFSHINAR